MSGDAGTRFEWRCAMRWLGKLFGALVSGLLALCMLAVPVALLTFCVWAVARMVS